MFSSNINIIISNPIHHAVEAVYYKQNQRNNRRRKINQPTTHSVIVKSEDNIKESVPQSANKGRQENGQEHRNLVSEPCTREHLSVKHVGQHIEEYTGKRNDHKSLEPYSHMRVILIFKGNPHKHYEENAKHKVEQVCSKKILLQSFKHDSSHTDLLSVN